MRRTPLTKPVIPTLVALVGAVTTASAMVPAVAWIRTSTASALNAPYANDMSALPDGTAVVVGQFSGSGLDLGDGVNRTSSASGAHDSAFVEHLDATGAVTWAQSSTGTGTGTAWARGVTAIPNGALLVVGGIQGSAVDLGDGVVRSPGVVTGFTERLNADGSIAWVRTTSGGVVGLNSPSALPDGGAIITGGVAGTNVDLGNGVLRSSANGGASTSLLIEKVAADGTVLWARASGSVGQSDSQGASASAFPDGTAIVAGTFQGAAVTLGDGITRTSANGGASGTLILEKVAADGSIAWIRTSSASGASYVTGRATASPDGTALVSGTFQGSGVDLGDGVARMSANGGLSNSAFTMRVRADGSVMWARTSSGTGASDTWSYGVAGLADGSAVIVGGFTGAVVDLGDGVVRSSAAGGTAPSAFTAFIAADGAVTGITTSIGGTGADGDTVQAMPDGSTVMAGGFTGSGVDLGGGVSRTSALGGTARSVYVTKMDGTAARPAPADAAAGTPPAAAADHLTARIRCSRGTCITTGTAPAGTRRISQTATRRRGSHSAARCTISARTGSGRTTRHYRCRVALTAGIWSVTTTARSASGALLATSIRQVTVRSARPPAVTG